MGDAECRNHCMVKYDDEDFCADQCENSVNWGMSRAASDRLFPSERMTKQEKQEKIDAECRNHCMVKYDDEDFCADQCENSVNWGMSRAVSDRLFPSERMTKQE